MSESLPAIILAAGLSSRMGAFKPLLPLGGKPLIQHVIDSLTHAARSANHPCHRAQCTRASRRSAQRSCPFCSQPQLRPRRNALEHSNRPARPGRGCPRRPPGPGRSTRRPTGHHPPNHHRLARPPPAARTPNVPGPPRPPHRSWSRNSGRRSRALPQGQTLKTVIHEHLPQALQLETNDAAVTVDMDTPEDYAKALAGWHEKTGTPPATPRVRGKRGDFAGFLGF